jgi:hypothetical protein
MAEEVITCLECGEEFATKEAHDIHHAEKHGGSISTTTSLSEEGDQK